MMRIEHAPSAVMQRLCQRSAAMTTNRWTPAASCTIPSRPHTLLRYASTINPAAQYNPSFHSRRFTSFTLHATAAPSSSPGPASNPHPTRGAVNYDLSGRAALVTGGSSGIGLGIARLLAEQGVRVALSSRSLARATEAAESIVAQTASLSNASANAAAHRPLAIECDVRDPAAVERMVDEAHRSFGRLDFVVHAAGVNVDALIVRAKDESVQASARHPPTVVIVPAEWLIQSHAPFCSLLLLCLCALSAIASQLQTNLVGAISLSRSVARRMLVQRSADGQPAGGRIIHIGSVVGQHGNAGQSVYAASKAGLHGQHSREAASISAQSELTRARLTSDLCTDVRSC
jgi:3-oxoacyl-[acyl-carrier protein] reductase